MPNTYPKPGRPFGLTLALIGIIIIYTILPMIPVIFTFLINDYTILQGGQIAAGIQIPRLDATPLIIQTFISVGLLIIAIFAWFGRPRFIRHILTGALSLLAVAMLVALVLPALTTPPDITQGIDSTDQLQAPLLIGYSVLLMGMTLYALWFVNRWSSRAYFRGYYTEEDMARLDA